MEEEDEENGGFIASVFCIEQEPFLDTFGLKYVTEIVVPETPSLK